MADRILLWFEFIVVVVPATLVVVATTLLFPFGAALRPELIIPAYLGGIIGIYSLWRMFLILVRKKGKVTKWIGLYYACGVYAIMSFPVATSCSTDPECWRFFVSPWMLPIIVGAHWLYLVLRGGLQHNKPFQTDAAKPRG